MTPPRTLLNHRPPSRASRGSSANSAKGFSSNVSTNSDGAGSDEIVPVCCCGGGAVGAGKDNVGVIFRNVLKATCQEVFC